MSGYIFIIEFNIVISEPLLYMVQSYCGYKNFLNYYELQLLK